MEIGKFFIKSVFAASMGLFVFGCGSSSEPLTQAELTAQLVDDGLEQVIAECVASELGDDYQEGDDSQEIIDEFAETCEEKLLSVEDIPQESTTDELAFAEPINYGDDEELDKLWDECEAGTGESCDELFMKSPINSEYEEFGLNCGRRPNILYCNELDAEDNGPTPKIAIDEETQEDIEE